MSTRNTLITIIIVTGVLLAAGAVLAPFLPAQGATHWNVQGNADGYSPIHFVILYLPLMGFGISLLILFLPMIDPKRANIELFRTDYNLFVIFFLGFMGTIHLLSLAWNLGWKVNMTRALIPPFAALCYFLGHLMKKARPNWFIGIRTPWTLSSETVWNATHQRVGMLFKVSSGVTLAGIFMRNSTVTFIFLIAPLLLVSFYAAFYSYLEYRKEREQ